MPPSTGSTPSFLDSRCAVAFSPSFSTAYETWSTRMRPWWHRLGSALDRGPFCRVHRPRSAVATPPYRFVDDDRSRRCHVEGVRPPHHRDADLVCRRGQNLVGQSVLLGSDGDRDRPRVVQVSVV